MTDEPDPLVEFLMEAAAERVKSAAERALPHLQAALADADGRFTSNPRQAAVSALLAVADFLALTCEPGIKHMPALPGARIFEALALDLRELDEGHVSALLTPPEKGHKPKLPEREWIRRLWAAVAVECRRLRLGGGHGALAKASGELTKESGEGEDAIGGELEGIDPEKLRRWHKEFQAGGNAPVTYKRTFEREFLDARRTPSRLLMLGTDAEKRAAHDQALAELEGMAIKLAKAWTGFIGRDDRAK